EFDAKVIKKYRCVVGSKAETPAPVPGPRGNPKGGVNRVTVPVAGSTVPIHASHPVGPQSLFKPKRVPVLGSNSMENRPAERGTLLTTLPVWVFIATNWPF